MMGGDSVLLQRKNRVGGVLAVLSVVAFLGALWMVFGYAPR